MRDLKRWPGVANLGASAYTELKRGSDSAEGDILLTLGVQMKWMDSLAMKKALAMSDFDLATLKDRGASLYLVIPTQYLQTHARYLRLFITLAMRSAGRGVKPRHPMLFILDEFATLGPLKVVEEAAGLLAGGGVRLWPIIQNLTQLRMYGDNWEVFVSNASQIQVFAMNDQTTARYFSERLGHHISWQKVRVQGGQTGEKKEQFEWVPQGATFLRTSTELARESQRDSGKSLIFFEGGSAAVMRRGGYDSVFWPWEYSPDPYEAGGRITKLKNFVRKVHDFNLERWLFELPEKVTAKRRKKYKKAAEDRQQQEEAQEAVQPAASPRTLELTPEPVEVPQEVVKADAPPSTSTLSPEAQAQEAELDEFMRGLGLDAPPVKKATTRMPRKVAAKGTTTPAKKRVKKTEIE